jgi:hypothetical protein
MDRAKSNRAQASSAQNNDSPRRSDLQHSFPAQIENADASCKDQFSVCTAENNAEVLVKIRPHQNRDATVNDDIRSLLGTFDADTPTWNCLASSDHTSRMAKDLILIPLWEVGYVEQILLIF